MCSYYNSYTVYVLIETAKKNGWKAVLRTVEIGARGFVNMDSMKLFRLVGHSPKQCNGIRKELSIVAVRASYFIWLNRDNKEWIQPARVIQ